MNLVAVVAAIFLFSLAGIFVTAAAVAIYRVYKAGRKDNIFYIEQIFSGVMLLVFSFVYSLAAIAIILELNQGV